MNFSDSFYFATFANYADYNYFADFVKMKNRADSKAVTFTQEHTLKSLLPACRFIGDCASAERKSKCLLNFQQNGND